MGDARADSSTYQGPSPLSVRRIADPSGQGVDTERLSMDGGVAHATERPSMPWVGRLLVPLVGVFFLYYPIGVVLAGEPTAVQVWLALGGAAVFVAVFLRLMWSRQPLRLVTPSPAQIWRYRATILLLAVLAGGLSFALGVEWRMLFLYHINVAAGMMLPKRDAYVAIAAVATIVFVLGLSVGLAWLVVPTVALGLWATAYVGQVVAVAQLQAAREELARLAVAGERLRFARDLHDLLGHSLSLIALKSELAGRLLPAAPERAAREMGDVNAVARRSLREVREAVAGYRQVTLREELAGAAALLDAAGIDCRIEDRAGPLPGSLDALLAWTIREGATNVIRHSRARHCTIRLLRVDDNPPAIAAEVCDDGRAAAPVRPRGQDPAPNAADGPIGGSGLAGLAERVAAVAGAGFAAGPRPEGGFRLAVRLPIEADALLGGEGGRR